ncbi:hypothetical protein [Rouxiella sp. Mn2063]|uniref:hypothetical protein n=1 Tax=Rouxiella sp. Mn2063 TaxID=3395262 RepID=UPI003BBAA62A
MSAKLPKFSYPVPSNKNGHAFSSAEELLSKLGGESSGQYLVGSQGMWHGGIHISDATIPWCALSTDSDAEKAYYNNLPYKGEQFIRCMADGEIIAWRVCKDYASAAITWRGEKLYLSTSFVLVKHYVQPGDTAASGLTFYTLYMNLAPSSAYERQGGDLNRKTTGSQRYYTSAENTQAGAAAGSLVKDTRVTLSDNIISRASDHRQFTEVTLTVETKNAAGVALKAGTKIWTVSDQGALKAVSSVPVPSWWTKCAPAYGTQPTDMVNCTSRTDWSYYLSREDVLQRKIAGKLAAGFPLTYEPDNKAQQVTRPGKDPEDTPNTFSLVTLGRDVGKMKKGNRVWVVSDGDSLTPAQATSGSQPVFGEVVKPLTPIAISAGDSIGHMGFYQLPEENGKRSRYQVHIECLSMDEKLPTFLTNPEKVGEQEPAFIKYPESATLFTKNAEGQMVDSTRKTRTQGIVTRSKVPVEDKDGQAAYYQIHKENGWLAASSVQKVSQYALGELGFVTLDKAPESFDLIDGIKHPDNIVKGILEQMYNAAKDETRTSHVLNEYNYKRLLELIDTNKDGHYSEEEYIQAIHNVSYRDHLYRIIAKHSSEWYYGKDDPLWKTYLETLTKDAPQWKTYTETFIEQMKWMKDVPEMGAEPWHMHPVVFLEAIKHQLCDCENIYADKFKVTRYGAVYGPIYKGEISLKDYSRWDFLASKGKVTLDEKEILIAMSENEGNMDAIQSYDSEVITAGAMQKTVKDTFNPNSSPVIDFRGKGELSIQFSIFKTLHPELYNRYAVNCGWTVEGTGSSATIYYNDAILTNGKKITAIDLKVLIRKGCSEETYGHVVHNKPLAALVKVLLLPEYIDLQILDFIDRLHLAENKIVVSNKKIKYFVKSKFGRAVVLDHSVNRPGNVVRDFKKAVDNFYKNNPQVNHDPAQWGSDFSKNEKNLLEEYKLTRVMTNSVGRFNSLKAKL